MSDEGKKVGIGTLMLQIAREHGITNEDVEALRKAIAENRSEHDDEAYFDELSQMFIGGEFEPVENDVSPKILKAGN